MATQPCACGLQIEGVMETQLNNKITFLLSKNDESTFREYSRRTGVDFAAVIQSAICSQIGCYKDHNPFYILQEIQSAEIATRKVTLEIHPLVSDFVSRAANVLGVASARLVALALRQDAECLSANLSGVDRHEADFGDIPAIAVPDLAYRAGEAVNLTFLLTLKEPILGFLKSDPYKVVSFENDVELLAKSEAWQVN